MKTTLETSVFSQLSDFNSRELFIIEVHSLVKNDAIKQIFREQRPIYGDPYGRSQRETTLETSGKDSKIHSKRVGKL